MEKPNTKFNSTSLISSFRNCKNEQKNVFINYIDKCFDDLVNRIQGKCTSIVFSGYLDLPLIISEQIFKHFNLNQTGNLKRTCFNKGMSEMYFGSLASLKLLAFQIFNMTEYDSKPSKVIYKNDVYLIFKYLENHIGDDKKFIKTEEVIDKFFSDKSSLSFDAYIKQVDLVNSDLFLLLIYYLYMRKPFTEKSVEFYKEVSNYEEETIIKLKSDDFSRGDLICTPSKDLLKFFKNNTTVEFTLKTGKSENEETRGGGSPVKDPKYKKINSSGTALKSRFSNVSDNDLEEQKFSSSMSPSKDAFISFSNLNGGDFTLRSAASESEDINKFSTSTTSETNNQMDLYKFTEKRELIKHRLILKDRDLYLFKLADEMTKEDTLQDIYPLNGYHIDSCSEMNKFGKTLFPFVLMKKFGSVMVNLRNFFICETLEDMNSFIKMINLLLDSKVMEDKYEIMLDLGKGHYGDVKLASNKQTKEKVAIKIVQKNEVRDHEIDIIFREIDIMKYFSRSNYTHPNIVHVLDIFEDKQNIYFVLEYLPGGSLTEFLHKHSIYDEDIKYIILKIVGGLDYLGKNGIVHRDIKPDNIVITINNGGKVNSLKIIDFGLSKIIGQNQTTNEGCGSLIYLAPEVILKEDYGINVDVWSFGILIFQLLAGTFPFNNNYGTDCTVVRDNIVNTELVFPDKIKIEGTVKKLLTHCLNKNPLERWKISQVMSYVSDF